MHTHNRSTFTTIHTEGALLPVDLLARIADNDAGLESLSPESYHLAPGEKINEAINRSWNRLNGLWGTFKTSRGRLGPGDAGTTLTRERWLLPLFQELGFGRLSTAKAEEIEGKLYPISHRGTTAGDSIPIHLIGCGLDLEKRTPGAAGASRTSPHSLLQEYLNRSEAAQWGMVSNGLTLRILRDNAALTRQAYLEFDLESILEGEIYSDFVLLWLICHQSRFETVEKHSECILEKWSKSAQEQGTRALDDLRKGVEEAITSLGQGFLRHPLNADLRKRLKSGELSAQDYYRQLLRLVYRLIFLFVAEDRDLLLRPDAAAQAKHRYLNYYSTARLRLLSERQRGSRHHDRYEALQLVMNLLGSAEGCAQLAIPALGGFLFDPVSTADLNGAKLDNLALLSAVRSLAFITEKNIRRAVDYRNLGTRELGSVYESLLELHPHTNIEAATFDLIVAAGNERKTTGSYYTAEDLIKLLLDSALDPVIAQAILRAGPSPEQQIAALLALKICDPACGSGHFLIAAARRIARRLAQLRSGDEEPSPDMTRAALREVIRHCMYGVDINPMSVELCKVNLWLESLQPGKPLSFLDAHIRCGNSLVGLGPKMQVSALEVPDEAFNPVTGDHKPTATQLKKRNKQEREGQESLFVTTLKTREDMDAWLAESARTLEAMPEDSATEVQAKAVAYQQVSLSAEYRKQHQIADLWTAAFFWQIKEPPEKTLEITAPTHGQLRRLLRGSATQPGLLEEVERLHQEVNFFHWPLDFAEVTEQGGFDCILGNPPWERIKLQEEEFFASRDTQIATATNKAARQKLIDQLVSTNPTLAIHFENAKHASEAQSKFLRFSKGFPLTAVGDVNTFPLFSELAYILISSNGRAGIIVPTAIATAEGTKGFFDTIVSNGQLFSLIDFLEARDYFTGLESRDPFCLLTMQGKGQKNNEAINFVFKVLLFTEINNPQRHVALFPSDFYLLNPNTRTCPKFYTNVDAMLTRKIYERAPVLVNEINDNNFWNISFSRLFDMTNDSGYFIEIANQDYLPLYEAKLLHHYDHRWATHFNQEFRNLTPEEKRNPNFKVQPRYWIPKKEVIRRLQDKWDKNWLLAFRNNARENDERSVIFSIIPLAGVGNSAPLLFFQENGNPLACTLVANLSSLVFDYIARQKIGGANFNFFIVKQLPVLPPETYSKADIDYIASRVIELSYTAYDLTPFAEDMGYHGEPFHWDEDRRALLRAELDAYYARLYGLTRDELRYVLDPQDVCGPDFPGETFRVLKEKEIRLYGEYRTRRLVLEAWDKLEVQEIGAKPVDREPATFPIMREAVEKVEEQQLMKPVTVKAPAGKPVAMKARLPDTNEPDQAESQLLLLDFGLYKCATCGKMVMGFERENHRKEKHSGKNVEWKRIGSL